MFLISVQIAIVERGFSLHHILKNRLTNRLNIMTLDFLLRIKLLTLGVDLQSLNSAAAAAAAAAKIHNYAPVAQERLKRGYEVACSVH
eukprot:300923-Pelagomonas_calceolata.AAC.4